MVTKLAVFSDIHANFPAMGEVASHIRDNDYDGVYCLGDLGGYASEPNETQELVMFMDCPTVLGNYDEGVGFGKDTCGCNLREHDKEIKDTHVEAHFISGQSTGKHGVRHG